MKATVLKTIGEVSLQDVAVPEIRDRGDAIVRVSVAGICGSDLHIVDGRDPGIRMETIMGHEFTGVIEEVGPDVSNLHSGDRVLSPFSINCGHCFFCLRGLTARCVRSLAFGFINEAGNGLHGTQAECVRVPLASSTLVKIPRSLTDEQVLFLGDIFSTAYSTAEKAEIAPGDTVVVVGCGPVGLLSILAAQLFKPAFIIAVDSVEYRLDKAAEFGAIPVKPEIQGVKQLLAEKTQGRGADACIEAVGNPAALNLAIDAARAGAVISIAGYHTEEVFPLRINAAYGKNLSIRIGRCNARKYIDLLLPLVAEARIRPERIITHVLPLSDAVRGYDMFRERKESAIKVLLKP